MTSGNYFWVHGPAKRSISQDRLDRLGRLGSLWMDEMRSTDKAPACCAQEDGNVLDDDGVHELVDALQSSKALA